MRWGRWFVAAWAAYVVLLGYVLLTPGPLGPSETVVGLTRLLELVGVSFEAGSRWPEFIMNVVLFVPGGVLGILSWPRSRPGDWAALAFLGATLVEVTQRYLLPDRVGEARDVVANTFGALLGAAVAWGVGWGADRLSRPGPARPRPAPPR